MLKNSTNEVHRRNAIHCLVYAHQRKGNLERAKELASSMPPLHLTSDFLLNALLEGEERERHIRNLRASLLDDLAIDIGTIEDKEYAAKKVIALYALLYEDGDYAFAHIRLYARWIVLAKAAAKRQEREGTLEALREAEKHALAFDAYVDAPEYTHTSTLFRGTHKPCVSMNYKENTAKGMLNELAAPFFDFVRDTQEFGAITDRLCAEAGEWKVKE